MYIDYYHEVCILKVDKFIKNSTCNILGESLAGEGVSVEERVHLPLHVVTQRLRLRVLGGEERPGFGILLLLLSRLLMLAILRWRRVVAVMVPLILLVIVNWSFRLFFRLENCWDFRNVFSLAHT